jgi:hypothetical protein
MYDLNKLIPPAGASALTGPIVQRQPGTDRYVPDGRWRVVGWNHGSNVGRSIERDAGCRARVFPHQFVQDWSVSA